MPIDLHLQNFLVKTRYNLDNLSTKEFRKSFKGPHLHTVKRQNGQPLTPHVPTYAVTAIDLLGKRARDFSVTDAKGLLLSDFGEAWRPSTEKRLGMDSCTPLPGRTPEALFEPSTPLSFASDIWTLGTAMWLMLGMKPLFSDFHFSMGELAGEQINSLGYDTLPQKWRTIWDSEPIDEGDELPRRLTADVEEGWPPPLLVAWEDSQSYRSDEPGVGEFTEEESQAILDVVRGMFRLDPERRWTIDNVLKSKWLARWALPELEKARQ